MPDEICCPFITIKSAIPHAARSPAGARKKGASGDTILIVANASIMRVYHLEVTNAIGRRVMAAQWDFWSGAARVGSAGACTSPTQIRSDPSPVQYRSRHRERSWQRLRSSVQTLGLAK